MAVLIKFLTVSEFRLQSVERFDGKIGVALSNVKFDAFEFLLHSSFVGQRKRIFIRRFFRW